MNIQDYVSYSEKFCDRYRYPVEAKNLFLETMAKIDSSKYRDEVYSILETYAKGNDIHFGDYLCNGKKDDGLCNRLAKELGISPYTVDFVFYLFFMPYLEKRYEAKGLSKEMFYGAMDDFRCKLWECKKVYGVWGTFVGSWFDRWFRVDRFAFGRLQFELTPHLWTTRFLKSPSGKITLVRLWQNYVGVHIPSSGPLDHDEVIESYKKAYAFFKKRFPFGKVCFHTSSWLLNPDHEKMLGNDSNIVKFARDYRLFRVGNEKTFEDFWRIYDRPYNPENPDTSGDSRMQKGYAEILKNGGYIKDGSGIFVYDGKEFYK